MPLGCRLLKRGIWAYSLIPWHCRRIQRAGRHQSACCSAYHCLLCNVSCSATEQAHLLHDYVSSTSSLNSNALPPFDTCASSDSTNLSPCWMANPPSGPSITCCFVLLAHLAAHPTIIYCGVGTIHFITLQSIHFFPVSPRPLVLAEQ